jgi:thiol-disulfide isomerase/thioredoxin
MTIISAFVVLLLVSTNFTCAFVVNVNPETSIASIYRSEQLSRLQAVAMPAEQEDEKQKKRKANIDDQNDSRGDWTKTKGGFIPNILKRRKSKKHPTIQLVDNINDYKAAVVDEKEQIVVVRFFASWCRSCKATKPLFNKLVRNFSDSRVKFVEVPLTKETAYLQEGLGVPSVPFAHIYHPDGGLVEEMKVSKPHFSKFSEKLNSYVVGSCDIPEDEDIDEAIGAFE